jgi:hypothetical protein
MVEFKLIERECLHHFSTSPGAAVAPSVEDVKVVLGMVEDDTHKVIFAMNDLGKEPPAKALSVKRVVSQDIEADCGISVMQLRVCILSPARSSD